MKIEHIALNVAEPQKLADWYIENLGLRLVRKMNESPYMTFLADDSEKVMIEIYNNPAVSVPDYQNMDPLLLHLAFVSADPERDKQRLEKAGASFHSKVETEDGSLLIMMKDPWGIAIQLCRRSNPMI